MVLPGHLAAGYLAAEAVISLFHPNLSSEQTTALLIIGTLAGEFPDIDTIFPVIGHLLHRKVKESHRDHITHAPIFWVLAACLISTAGWLFQSSFIEWTGLMILTGTLSHFAMDSIDWGIAWAWPFSKKRFHLYYPEDTLSALGDVTPGTLKYYWHFAHKAYPKTATFWLEIIVTLLALCILLARWI